MPELQVDRTRGVANITLQYDGGKREVIVSLRPDLKTRTLECTDVRVRKGEGLKRDERYLFMVHAEREFMAVLKNWLKPRPSHVKVSSLAERVELSYAYTLAHLDPKDKAKICPLGYEDLRVLQMLTRDISDGIANLNSQADAEGRKLPSGYLEDIKSGVLKQWREHTPCTDARRNFYSSVLGRAFAWKQGRIPYEQYTEAMKYVPGIKLAFGQQ